MLRDKRFWFLLFLTVLLRLPTFLFRGAPSGDESNYFDQALDLISHGPGWQGVESVQAAPKLLFILLNAPSVWSVYSLTHNAGLSAAVLPFLISIAGLLAVYVVGRRLYGPAGAYWAGLLYAVMPSIAFHSSVMTAEQMYVFFYLVGLILLGNYLAEGKKGQLIAVMLLFAALCKVRPEGIVIFALSLALVSARCWKASPVGTGVIRSIIGVVTVSTICFLGSNLFFAFLTRSGLVPISPGPGIGSFPGHILGNLGRRVTSMFGVGLPGGLTASGNKLGYIMENWRIVSLASVLVLYDVLKTVLILPTRIIPPAFFLFLGLSCAYDEPRPSHLRYLEVFILSSSLMILFYPVLFQLSFSRYMFILTPIAVFLGARGLVVLEKRMTLHPAVWLGKHIRTILTVSILLYVVTGFYFLQAGALYREGAGTVFANQGEMSRNRNKSMLVEQLRQGYSGKNITVMGEGDWWHRLEGVNKSLFPFRVGLVDGLWVTLPLSSEDVMDSLSAKKPALLVLSRSQFYPVVRPGVTNYFRKSLSLNLGDGDEGLEIMRPPEENDNYSIYKNLKFIWDGDSLSVGLRLVETVASPDDPDSLKVFLLER